MDEGSALREMIARAVDAQGLGLFDVEMPGAGGGALRIFLCQRDGSTEGIGLGECAAVSKSLATPEFDDLIPDHTVLEVSSPGLNRKLRREDHFRGAIGERIKVTVEKGDPEKRGREIITGKLTGCDGQKIQLIQDRGRLGETAREIPLSSVKEARVQFAFK